MVTSLGLGDHAWLSLWTMALIHPLHEDLKTSSNHLSFPMRGTPYPMLESRSYPAQPTPEPHHLLANVAMVIAQQLELPYVGITIGLASERTQAHAGTPGPELKRFPLWVHDKFTGWLEVSPRSGEAFHAEEQQMLQGLAEQVGTIVQSLELSAERQATQKTLLTTREEERLRWQRDLHDGLGSTLSAQSLVVGSARRLLDTDPQEADRLLSQLESDMQDTLVGVRKLVYRLRPPELDQLGLADALRLKLKGLASGRLRLELVLPAAPLGCPAATEVTVYRLVTEAVANVVRHARARSCRVELKITETGLEIEVTADGKGCNHRRGGGLAALHERVHELGGELSVTHNQPGVRVWASLPLQ